MKKPSRKSWHGRLAPVRLPQNGGAWAGRPCHVRSLIEPLEDRLHLAAQAYDWRNVTMKGTGFINGVVFSPAQAGLAYANTDMGGAYRWNASAARWTPLTDWPETTDWSVNYNGAETIRSEE